MVVLLIFRVIFQTVINFRMLSNGGQECPLSKKTNDERDELS